MRVVNLWGDDRTWLVVPKFAPAAARLADGHYSRRTIGSPQFMPPGQTLVLMTPDELALFGWWRPHPSSGVRAMNGLDGWTCTIFRNTGPMLSSRLILAAESELLGRYDVGPDGFITYVWDARVASVNPGYCFKVAGWRATGRSADGRKTLLQKSPDGFPIERPFGRMVAEEAPRSSGASQRIQCHGGSGPATRPAARSRVASEV